MFRVGDRVRFRDDDGEWNPAVHLTDRKVLPREWRRVWAVDFGFTNPFVWQMWAIDPDGRLWLEKAHAT